MPKYRVAFESISWPRGYTALRKTFETEEEAEAYANEQRRWTGEHFRYRVEKMSLWQRFIKWLRP